MKPAACLAAVALAAALAAPLAAQSQGDRVRLDDFAVAARVHPTLQVEQLPSDAASVDAAQQSGDRSVDAEQPAATPTTALPQLSARGQSPEPAQLSKAGAPPDESAAAVSSTAQSRPQGVAHLGGSDRCDPQLAKEDLERCRRILELRAQEFNAPAPPQLSPEQRLLAEQQSIEEGSASRQTTTRLRLASRDDPDADLQSNQELAALYLARQNAPPPQQPDEQSEPGGDATLNAVVDALQAAAAGGQGTP